MGNAMSAETSFLINQQLTKGDRTKIQILQETLRCIAQSGFEGLSLGKIAQTLSVNRSLPIHYYGSSEKLVQEVIAYSFKFSKHYTDTNLKLETSGDPVQRYVQVSFDFLHQYPLHVALKLQLVNKSVYDKGTKKQVLDYYQRVNQRIEALLLQGQNQGFYPAVTVNATLALEIHTILAGFITMALTRKKLVQEDLKQSCINVMASHLGTTNNRKATGFHQ